MHATRVMTLEPHLAAAGRPLPQVKLAIVAAGTPLPRTVCNMIWIVLEIGVALLLAGLIVWLTLGGKRKIPPHVEEHRDDRPPH